MSFWCLDDPRCPMRMWSREQVIAVYDTLDDLLFCIRRAHPKILADHDRWDELVEETSATPGNIDDDD
jgi:hypothetical protein